MGCLLKQGGGLYPRLHIGAVVLAAGEGRRMGGVCKPLIRLQGVPIVTRLLIALSGAGVDEVVVVTGFARTQVEAQIGTFPITLVYNPDFADGQGGSVHAGLGALAGPFDAVLVALADQPLLGADDLRELIGAFKKRPGGHVLVPMVDGRRGNPVVLDGEACDVILRGEAKLGCRHLVEQRPEFVSRYDSPNHHYIVDLDTPEDLERLAATSGWRLELPEVRAAA